MDRWEFGLIGPLGGVLQPPYGTLRRCGVLSLAAPQSSENPTSRREHPPPDVALSFGCHDVGAGQHCVCVGGVP